MASAEFLSIALAVPPEVFEEIAAEATRRVLAALRDNGSRGRWLTGAAAAADYLGCSPKRPARGYGFHRAALQLVVAMETTP